MINHLFYSSESHQAHTTSVEAFLEAAQAAGKEIVFKQDKEIENGFDTTGIDLVISLGGDRNYLKAQSLCKDWSTPILGINTTIKTVKSALQDMHIDSQ
jgi:NAD kinase